MDSGYNISDAYVATQLREEIYMMSRALAYTQIENEKLWAALDWAAEQAYQMGYCSEYDAAGMIRSKIKELRNQNDI